MIINFSIICHIPQTDINTCRCFFFVSSISCKKLVTHMQTKKIPRLRHTKTSRRTKTRPSNKKQERVTGNAGL